MVSPLTDARQNGSTGRPAPAVAISPRSVFPERAMSSRVKIVDQTGLRRVSRIENSWSMWLSRASAAREAGDNHTITRRPLSLGIVTLTSLEP